MSFSVRTNESISVFRELHRSHLISISCYVPPCMVQGQLGTREYRGGKAKRRLFSDRSFKFDFQDEHSAPKLPTIA